MRLLLHICCGPCAVGALPFWQAKTDQIEGFFYNPNIHPLLEYRRRLTGAREVTETSGVGLGVDDTYDPRAWFESIGTAETGRCARCIGQRLRRTAEEAAVRGCDAFSTTLSISPWQDHSAIVTEGSRAAELHGVEFMYQDLRPLFGGSRTRSRELGIYRQKYCGCLISEWERYRGRCG